MQEQDDTGNNRGNWNGIKIIQKIPEQYEYTGKTRNQETTGSNLIGHCAYVPESTNLKVQNVCMGNNLKCNIYCKCSIAVTLYSS
jgi:hypothetical protein